MSTARAAEPPERAPQSGTRSMPASRLRVRTCDSRDRGRAGSWLLHPIVLYREAPASRLSHFHVLEVASSVFAVHPFNLPKLGLAGAHVEGFTCMRVRRNARSH